MKKAISLLLAFILISLPVAVLAQDAEITDVCLQAQADAKQDINSWLWIGAGCVFHLLGVGAAYLVKSGPPPERLIGKSVEYVNSYTECYVKQARKSQGGSAWIGCGVAGGVYLITGTILMIAAANSASNACSDACSGVTIDCTPDLNLFSR